MSPRSWQNGLRSSTKKVGNDSSIDQSYLRNPTVSQSNQKLPAVFLRLTTSKPDKNGEMPKSLSKRATMSAAKALKNSIEEEEEDQLPIS